MKINQINLEIGCIEPDTCGEYRDTKFFAKWAIPYIKPWVEFRITHGTAGDFLFTKVFKGGGINDVPLTGRGITYILASRSKICGLTYNVSPSGVRRAIGNAVIQEYGLHVAQKVLNHVSTTTTKKY